MTARTPRLDIDLPRVYGLSDGVFAIVLTLLVLELKVPTTLEPGEFARQVHELGTAFVAYLITFAAIALLWVSHTRFFSSIHRADRRLQYLNLLFLFFLTVMPFTTAFLSRHPLFAQAQLVYGASMVAISLTLWAMWRRAAGRQLLRPEITGRQRRYLMWRVLDAPLVFLLWCGVALVAPRYTPWVALLLVVSGRLVALAFREEDAADEG